MRLRILVSPLAVVGLLAGGTGIAAAEQEGGGGGRGGRGGGAAAKPAPPVPRMPDGTPSLSWADEANKGVWRTGQHRDFAADLVDKAAGIPFQPWAKAVYDYRIKTEQKDDPEGFCLPAGGISATNYAIVYKQQNYTAWAPLLWPIKVIMTVGIFLMLLQAISFFLKDVAEARGEPIA